MRESTWEAFDLSRLLEKCETRGSTPYLEFLRVPQLSCGIYSLAEGAEDAQSTHDEDEVYVVLKGRGSLVVDGEETELSEGSIVYVPADVPHGFVKIEQRLSLLVFFGSGGPSGGEV